MSQNVCPQCGAPRGADDIECKYCGEKFEVKQQTQTPQPQVVYQQAPPPQIIYQQAPPQPTYVSGINPSWPIKSKIAAGLLAIFLGGIGVHKFYMGETGMGILYLVFCWTGIPAIIGFIEGIIYLCSNDENFQLKHHVRLG